MFFRIRGAPQVPWIRLGCLTFAVFLTLDDVLFSCFDPDLILEMQALHILRVLMHCDVLQLHSTAAGSVQLPFASPFT